MASITRVREQNSTAMPTKEESLALMRNLLRTAISSVVYLRNIFPEDCFKDRSLTGINIKALVPKCAGAKLLIAWLEKGVFDALEKKYLQSIIFGVYTDPNNATELVESFNFNIAYEETNHKLDICDANKKKTITTSNTSKAEIKNATLTMMRHLAILSQTLEPLPEEHYLTIKLLYHPHTPEAYEPPFFKSASKEEPLRFVSKPVKIKIGNVATPYHCLSMKIKTVSGVGEYEEEETEADTTNECEAEDDSQPLWENRRGDNGKNSVYQIIKSVVVNQKDLTIDDLKKKFSHVGNTILEECLQQLRAENILHVPSNIQEEDEVQDNQFLELVRLIRDEKSISIKRIRSLLSADTNLAKKLYQKLLSTTIIKQTSNNAKEGMINQKKLKNYLSEIEINTSNAKVLGKRKKNEETRLQDPRSAKKCSVVQEPICGKN